MPAAQLRSQHPCEGRPDTGVCACDLGGALWGWRLEDPQSSMLSQPAQNPELQAEAGRWRAIEEGTHCQLLASTFTLMMSVQRVHARAHTQTHGNTRIKKVNILIKHTYLEMATVIFVVGKKKIQTLKGLYGLC